MAGPSRIYNMQDATTSQLPGLDASGTGTDDPDRQQFTNIDRVFEEFLENTVLENAELVQAAQATDGRSHAAVKRSAMTNWSSVKETLALLAFYPDAADHWRFLGIPREEGPLPDLAMIERRVQLGNLFASLGRSSKWSENDIASARRFGEHLEIARKACAEDLPRLQREKRKQRSKIIPRWLEPSADLFQLLHSRTQHAGGKQKVALHLSNLQDLPLQSFQHAMPTDEARRIYEAIYKSAATFSDILQAITGGSLIVWAPTEHSTVAQLAATFQKYALQPGASGEVQLLIPHDPYPGCSTPTQVLDLWRHELFSPKWKSIVSKIEFLRQPTRCVFSGHTGPMHHVKSIAICTLSTTGVITETTSTQWRHTLGHGSSGPTLIVDCKSENELSTHRALIEANLPGLLSWTGPRKSIGSRGNDRRISFTGYFDEQAVSNLDMRLYTRTLRNNQVLGEALIGQQDLFTDPGALLVDFGHVRALTQAIDSVDECVLVSPRLALVTTPCRTEHWRVVMTSQLASDPLGAITKIRFRQSQHGGRPWATPEALPMQIRSARNRAAQAQATTAGATQRNELQSTLRLSDAAAGRTDELLSLILQKIGGVTNVGFRPVEDERTLQPYEVRPIRTQLGKWTGTLEFACASSAELRAIHTSLHGNSIEISGICAIVEVENDFKDLTCVESTMQAPAPATYVQQAFIPTGFPLQDARGVTEAG